MRLFLLSLLLLLLSSCGVSSSQKERMAEDFRNKFTALYLAPDAPGVIEDVDVYDFERGGAFGCGAFHANFSASHIGDGGRSSIYGIVGFDSNGYVAFHDSLHLSVHVIVVTDASSARSVPSSEWMNYLPSQILH